MVKTGQTLREARENQGISIQEVSVHLKINNRILRALEEGDQRQLPAKTFLRGFVKSYAQFLRLDEKEILSLFQAEMGTTHPNMITTQVESEVADFRSDFVYPESNVGLGPMGTESSNGTAESSIENVSTKVNPSIKGAINGAGATVSDFSTPTPIKSPSVGGLSIDHRTWSKSMQLATVAFIILIGGIIYGVIKTIEKYEREATTSPNLPVQLEAVNRTSPDTLSPTPESGSPESMDAAGVMDEKVKQAEGRPEALSAETVGVNSTSAVPVTSQEVIVEALDRVVIDYTIDDKQKASIVLNAEKVHTFRGDKSVVLDVSDGGTVNIIYNNKDKGVPGTLGQRIKLSFPQ